MSDLLAAEPPKRLPRSRRILHSKDYRAVTRNKPARSDRFFVVYAKQRDNACGRIGITVSRRVSTKAVDRNRIKRTIRESFRLQRMHLAKLDVVAIARREAKDANPNQLRSSLAYHWDNLGRSL